MHQPPPGAQRTVGELIRRYRELAGLSQEALAERATMSPRGLLYLERGLRRPYPATLRRLADALGLTDQEREALMLAARQGAAAEPPTVRTEIDAPEPRAAYSTTGTPPDRPAAETAEAPPGGPRHNLPVSLSSFIGREQAQARVHDLLASHRLVTLVGAGGVGKTRLALAVAEGVVDAYPDGVWLVELAPLADPALLPGTVARTLGLREEPGRPPLEMLRDYCRGRSLVLLLDNCEHLLPACTALAGALLRAAPELRILATSREALGVAGERRYRVPPLSVPDPEHLPSPELAGSYEAVRLFVARAQERRDSFALTDGNARAVAEICARLDGLPLAIELAAARVSSMSVEMIAAHLHDRFRLLTTGSEDLPTRQRTLRAALDWSWDLLGARERTLLGRFSVFAGGWTLEAATGICGDRELDYWAVVDGLDTLVNRSLAHMDESPAGTVRYRLLESVRQHAAEQLAAAREEATTRDSHLSYFLSLAEQAVQAFRGAEMGPWLVRLEQEHDNLRAALSWAREREKGEEALQLAAALAPFWEFRGHIAEGRRRLEELLAAFQGSPGARARALNAAGFLTVRAGDCRAALALYEESLALRRALGDRLGMAVALNNLANAHIDLGEYAQAESAYGETLELFRAVGDQWGVATAVNNLSVAARELGQHERAEALAKESLALRRAQDDPRGVAEATNNLAVVALVQGRHEQAAALFKEGLLLSKDVGDVLRILEALEGLSWAAAPLGQPQRAARLGAAAGAERERLGLSLGTPDRTYRDRAILATRTALGEEAFAAAWAEGRDVTLSEAIALALAAG
ncbi:MAG TPA: tetratricopeptide repeat protein [Chloroflexota bacterium]|nr:tetratricopeptide repeat protein [Chloroflexota bacterium]